MNKDKENLQDPTQPIELTADERMIIIFALGAASAMAFRDANQKPNDIADGCLRVARKFGVTL